MPIYPGTSKMKCVHEKRSVWYAAAVYALILATFACAIWKYPSITWDALAYLAEVHLYDGQRGCSVHDQVYKEAAEALPATKYKSLAGGMWQRQEWANSCGAFFEELPFYAVRPGYIGFALLLHRVGLRPVNALVLVSIICFLMIAVLFFIWTLRYDAPWRSMVISSGTMLALSPVARLVTPDIMSTLAILGALFVAHEFRKGELAVLLGIIAVTVRTDNVIFVACLTTFLVLRRQVRLFHGVVAVVTSVALVLMINHVSGNYGLLVLLQHSFEGYMVHPAQAVVHFSFMRHSMLIAHNGVELIFADALGVLFAVYAATSAGRLKSVFWLVAIVTVVKFVLYPSADTRHLAPLVAVSSLTLAGRLQLYNSRQRDIRTQTASNCWSISIDRVECS